MSKRVGILACAVVLLVAALAALLYLFFREPTTKLGMDSRYGEPGILTGAERGYSGGDWDYMYQHSSWFRYEFIYVDVDETRRIINRMTVVP